MQQVKTVAPEPLTDLDRLYSWPIYKLEEGLALLSERYEDEIQLWADATGNNDPDGMLTHLQAALELSKQLETVTWIISIKKHNQDK